MSLTDWVGGSESKSKSYIDEDQKGYLNDIWGNAQSLYNSGHSSVASMTPEMQNYLQNTGFFTGNAGNMSGQAWGQAGNSFDVGNSAGNYVNNVFQSGGFSTPTQNGVNMNTVDSLINNDVLNGQITAATRDIYRGLDEQTMPGIASNSVATGNTGSTRRGVAEAIAQRGADDRAADVGAGMRYDAYNDAVGIAANQAAGNQNATLNTNNLNANFGTTAFNSGTGLGYQGLGTGYDIGAGSINLQGNAANTAQGYAQQVAMAPWQDLSLYQGAIGSPTVLNQSSSSSTGGILPATGQFMDGAGKGATAIAQLSDARLKTNIQPITGTLGGFQLYRWDWKPEAEAFGLSGSESGVIAQEVARGRPDAIVEDASGYLMVNYAALAAA